MGRLAEQRDVAGLQAALATTLDNYDAFDRDEIRRYAMEQFDYRSVARRIHQVYQQVAAG